MESIGAPLGTPAAGVLAARLDELTSMADDAREGGERARRIVADLKTLREGERVSPNLFLDKPCAAEPLRDTVRHRVRARQGSKPR